MPAAVGRLARDVQERWHRQQDLRLGIAQLVLELACRVERVHGRRPSAGAGDPVEGDRVLGQVGHVDGERVPGAEASRREAGRQRARRLVELGEGDRPPGRPVDQRRLVAQLARALEHERGDVAVGELQLLHRREA